VPAHRRTAPDSRRRRLHGRQELRGCASGRRRGCLLVVMEVVELKVVQLQLHVLRLPPYPRGTNGAGRRSAARGRRARRRQHVGAEKGQMPCS
jgi:hypothetical protein